MPRAFRLLAGGVLLALLSGAASADSYVEYGDYRIYYNAFSSDMLAPQVAKQYDIPRSGYRAVLNITVRKEMPDGGDKAVRADVSATAANLAGQVKRLNLREIDEQEAVYYIAVFPVADEEVLDFDVRVRPADEENAYDLRFRQQFFVP